jgi:hypothetical protein
MGGVRAVTAEKRLQSGLDLPSYRHAGEDGKLSFEHKIP